MTLTDSTRYMYTAAISKQISFIHLRESQLLSELDYCITMNITETSPYKSDPRFSPNIVKWGKSGVGIKMIQMEIFQCFSIKSYVVDAY